MRHINDYVLQKSLRVLLRKGIWNDMYIPEGRICGKQSRGTLSRARLSETAPSVPTAALHSALNLVDA